MAALYDQITASIIEAISAGAETYEMPWHRNAGGAPRNAITGRPYRGVNVLVLWSATRHAGYASNLWATFNQWKSAGAQVRKGERSTVVLLYRPIGEEPGEHGGDEPRWQKVVARAFRVFSADQVDGFEAPASPRMAEAEQIAHAGAFFDAQGAEVWLGADTAFFDPHSDTISMPAFATFKRAEGFYSVLAHEFGHWTGAKTRLNRDLSGRFGTAAYAMEELIAELTAAFVTAHLRLDNEPRRDHAPYIASWLRVLRDDNRAIMAAASRAQAAADFLIARADERGLPQAPKFDAAPQEMLVA